MKHLNYIVALALYATFIPSSILAQGTIDDFNRAYSLKRTFAEDSVYHWAHGVGWRDSSYVVHYHINTPDGRRFVTFDVASGQTKTYKSQNDMNEALGIKTRQSKNNQTFGRRHQRHWMEVDEENKPYPVISPDGKFEAYIEEYNVVLHEVGKPYSQKRILSQDGTIGCYYSNRIQWSPDGNYIFVCKRTPVEKRYVYYIESSPADQLQPILHKQEYAKPGDALPQFLPVIFNIKTGTKVEADPHKIENQYSLNSFRWSPDSKEITMEYNRRGHKLYQLLGMNVNSGLLHTIVEESNNTFVNYPRLWNMFINDGKQLLWVSERDNWNHLYLYDVETAQLVRQITKGEWCVRRVLDVDEQNKVIYFTASGVNPKEDPYLIHYYRINFDGKHMIDLTPEYGQHEATFTYDHRYIVDTYSKVNQAPVTVVRDTQNGKLIKVLETTDISTLLKHNWQAPEVFVAKGRDGKTNIWGNIYRPSNFDPLKNYPIIEYIYAGPGDAYAQKSFTPYNWNITSLSELGFIVVQLDAMGTGWRGKKFEDVCYKNLKDAGFPDRELWIKAAAKKHPYMDATRVGIFGASAGGQESTTAVLLHGDFYKAAYSSCGCHDNRMDKIWWNELWMGYPIDSSYVESSNVANASKLERPLMLVVGELDDNVDPASTMQVANALIKANKDFELVVVPGAHHTMGENFGEHKRYDFFVKNLLGITPPRWNQINAK